MGSFSYSTTSPAKASPASPSSIRIVIAGADREVSSLDEARGFLAEHDADVLADLLLADVTDDQAPEALIAFRARLERMCAAL